MSECNRKDQRRAIARWALFATVALVPVALVPVMARAQDAASVRSLPLIELPVTGTRSEVAIVLSGDGGWADIDRKIGEDLAAHGLAVVGFDTRAYLRKKRTPDEVATDLRRVVAYEMARTHRDRVLLAGYSRGADLLVFAAARMAPDLRAHVPLVALLGLGQRTGFEFHWIDVVKDVHRPDDRLTAPEVARMRGMRMLCVYGLEEKASGCAGQDSTLMHVVSRSGSHHFDGDYHALSQLILRELPNP